MVIRTPDHRLRVFVSSTLRELAEERKAVRQAILELHLAPVMFESGARPHPAAKLYQSYLSQSQIFIAIYWQSYGWIAPGMSISGLEDEYNLSVGMPRLVYIKNPAPDRETALTELLNRIEDENTSCYTYFSTPEELKELVKNDLALMLCEYFEANSPVGQPTIKKSQPPPTNVPVPRNTMIDRKRELATTHNLLLRDDVALVTITGPGGTGKSRLGLHIGLDMLDHFRDGVYLVRLEPISDPDLVISTIAETLGIHESTGSRPVAEMLKDFLHDKQMLLVLDNVEQVLAAASNIGELLEACPRLKSIVTSRIPLRLRAEKEIQVQPLKVPSMKKFIDLHHLSQYAAVELFIQRAQAVKPDFSITNANGPAVAEICYCLDGLPLAIELAASRIKLLTPNELLNRLGHGFDLLHGGVRDLPERQRTLRGAIDWSYNLLNEPEQKLFRRLSIFVGGWTLEAAERICVLDGDLALDLDDLLATLIDANLVIPIQEAEEQSRYEMLVTIHEYSFERLLDCGEADIIRRQHARYYLDFVRTVEPRVRSAERVKWQRVLLKEFGNIRRVLEWISTTGNYIEIGQQIINTLGFLWLASGYITEGRQWCSQILSVSGESTPIATRAALLGVAGMFAWAQGDYSSAQVSCEESLELFHSVKIETLDDKHAYAMTMIVRGSLASASRDLSTAMKMYQECIEILKEINDTWLEVIATSFLGDIAMYENDSQRASTLYNQSIKLARKQGDPWVLMPSLMASGQYAIMSGDLANARSIFQEVEDLLRKTGDRWSLSWALNDEGHVALMNGELDLATVIFLEGINLADTLGNRNALLISLYGIAALIVKRSMEQKNHEKQTGLELAIAARICGATSTYVNQPGFFIWPDTKMLFDSDIMQVQSSLGKELWDRAFSEGQDMSLDQVVDLAMQSLKWIVHEAIG